MEIFQTKKQRGNQQISSLNNRKYHSIRLFPSCQSEHVSFQLCATEETKASRCNRGNILESCTENTFIIDVLDAKPKACWEGADQDVEIKEEGDPRGGLVLRHRRDDGDVDLGVAVERGRKRQAGFLIQARSGNVDTINTTNLPD